MVCYQHGLGESLSLASLFQDRPVLGWTTLGVRVPVSPIRVPVLLVCDTRLILDTDYRPSVALSAHLGEIPLIVQTN